MSVYPDSLCSPFSFTYIRFTHNRFSRMAGFQLRYGTDPSLFARITGLGGASDGV